MLSKSSMRENCGSLCLVQTGRRAERTTTQLRAVSWGPSISVTKTYSYFFKLRFELILGLHPTPTVQDALEGLPQLEFIRVRTGQGCLNRTVLLPPCLAPWALRCHANIRTEPRARRSDSQRRAYATPTQRYLSRLARE